MTEEEYTQFATKEKREEIGGGNTAKVFKVQWNFKPYAVKIYKEDDLESWKREKYILSLLYHQNICKLYSFYQKKDSNILRMELLDIDIESALPEIYKGGWKNCLSILKQIAKGVEYVSSESYVIGDLKTRNIMLNEKKEVKIIDFGSSGKVGTYIKVCSNGYTAPEIKKDGKAGSDVYSFGVIVMQLAMKGDEDIVGLTPRSINEMNRLGNIYQTGRTKIQREETIFHKDWVKEEGWAEETAKKIERMAMKCVSFTGSNRPTAKDVVNILDSC